MYALPFILKSKLSQLWSYLQVKTSRLSLLCHSQLKVKLLNWIKSFAFGPKCPRLISRNELVLSPTLLQCRCPVDVAGNRWTIINRHFKQPLSFPSISWAAPTPLKCKLQFLGGPPPNPLCRLQVTNSKQSGSCTITTGWDLHRDSATVLTLHARNHKIKIIYFQEHTHHGANVSLGGGG